MGGIWAGVEEDPAEDFRKVGSGWAMGLKVRVGEGRVPTGGEGRAVAQVAGIGLEEGLGAGTSDEAGAKVGVEKSTADKVCAVESGGGARGSGVGDGRKKSGVFAWEEGIGKVGEGLANARETGGREENIETAVVVRERGEVEAPSAVAAQDLRERGESKATTSWLGGWMGWGAKSKGTR